MATSINSILPEYVLNNSTNATCSEAPRHAEAMFGIMFKVVYAIGIVGNAAAIIALRKGERRIRNRKHLLLLTSLASNDLVALVSIPSLNSYKIRVPTYFTVCECCIANSCDSQYYVSDFIVFCTICIGTFIIYLPIPAEAKPINLCNYKH